MTTLPPTSLFPALAGPTRPSPETAAPASFRDHLSRGLSVASQVALAASTVVPGAGLVSLALGGISRLVGASREGAGPGGSAGIAGGPLAEGGGLGGGLEAYVASSRSLNSRYLLLQESMAREARAFTALSNIMRARHDAAQNAISNIR